jgi:hypothetical protein
MFGKISKIKIETIDIHQMFRVTINKTKIIETIEIENVKDRGVKHKLQFDKDLEKIGQKI